ncbi:MAG: polysaccharide biosynthesis tyrosine autokinase [Roseovarius sp.]|nr:polysaccharide biosynthesis tyrosine autokinase [Roseovarius sp.]
MNFTQRQDFLTGPASAAEERNEINLAEFFRTLWRGKFWIMLCVVLAMVVGAYYAFAIKVPVYTTHSVVALESRQEQVVDIESVMTGLGGDQATINTEVEVILSRGLIYKLVDKLGLINDPEFNVELRPEPTVSINRGIRWIRKQIQGPLPPKPPLNEQAVKDRTVDMVLEAIAATNVRQSYVFHITAVTEDPVKSAAMANTLAELYIREQLEVKFAATEKATEWLAERVTQLQVELEAAESQLKEFGTNTNLISPEALAALNRQLKELRDRKADIETEFTRGTTRASELKAARDSGDLIAMARAIGDRALTTRAEAATTDDLMLRGQIEDRLSQAAARSVQTQERIRTQLAALSESITEVEKQIETQSGELVRLQQLQRETEASRLIYEYFLSRLKETSVQQGIQQADSRILSRAVVPGEPSAPRKTMILALSLILGFLIGAAFVLIREFSQNTFRAGEQLEARTGYTVLGQIPMIPARRRKKVLQYLSERPNSAAAEAIRNLRTSVLLSNLDKHPQIIMSTSSVPGEGKTTTSLALTQNLAGLDKKVLLVEGDIRRRTFAQYFNIKGRNGLLSVLSGEVPLAEAVVHEPSLKADVLIGEKSSTNAADVFSSKRFGEFLAELREAYDYIVIDTPPVLAVPDARVIGQSVDAILYSVKWDHTTHRQVQDGLKSFESVNAKITGLVLGQISPRGLKRYGYGDGYGAYDSYYNT